MAAHHPQSYPVMTSSQTYSHNGTLLESPVMSIDLDKTTHDFNQISPPSSSGSSHSSMMYGAEHLNFAAAPGAGTFGHQATAYADNHHHSPTQHVHGESHPLALDPFHLRNTTVGPSRVLTRRQARAAQQQATAVHGPAADNDSHANLQNNPFDEGFIYPAAVSSRAQTPNRSRPGAHFVDQQSNLSDLSIGTTALNLHHAAMSPPHPGTPASVTSSSNFSNYGFHPYATHSRSTSSSTFPRSASPAMSVMSAATSLSSHSCRPRPPLSSGSISSFPTTSKPKKRLVNRERKEICQFYIDNPTVRQEDIAARWGVERSTVSKILKHKNKWLAIPEGEDQQVAKHRPSKFPEIEATLREWLSECRAKKQLIQDIAIRQKAREVAREMHIGEDKFKASAGWVENFKHRHGIKKGIWIGRNGGQEPPIIIDDESESEGETLSEFRERQDREMALRKAAEAAIREKEAAQRQQQDQLHDQVAMDIAGTVMNQALQPVQPSAVEQKIAPNSNDQWPPPMLPSANDGLMNFDSNATNAHDENGVTSLTQSNEDQRQQMALDCQPPPPYQSDMSHMDNSGNQSSNALAMQGMNESIPHYPTMQMQHGLQNQHMAFSPTQAWNAARATVQDPVTAHEASLAIEKVILFLKAQQPGYVRSEELNVITDVKHMIWVSAATVQHTNAAVTMPNTASTNQAQNTPKSS